MPCHSSLQIKYTVTFDTAPRLRISFLFNPILFIFVNFHSQKLQLFEFLLETDTPRPWHETLVFPHL